MTKKEKEGRSKDVILEGNKTKEGRLKIEEIKKLKHDSDNFKANIGFWAIMSVIEEVIRLIAYNVISNESIAKLLPITRLTPAALIVMIVYMYQKKKADKDIYNAEEEILKNRL